VKRWKTLIHVRGSLWFVPVLCVLAGAAISFSTITLDRLFDYKAIPASIVGHPEAAISIVSTVAASMVSLTALVLTITMVVVQLAMGQFSPRIVQRILRDKPSQLAIGLRARFDVEVAVNHADQVEPYSRVDANVAFDLSANHRLLADPVLHG
jgi:uncharacterized membrane protein